MFEVGWEAACGGGGGWEQQEVGTNQLSSNCSSGPPDAVLLEIFVQ